MRGDASDGLPGVPGVGEKTASALLLKYGDLEGIIAAAENPDSDMAPARARGSWPPRTTSRWPRRSSRSPATSSSAGTTPPCPPSRAHPQNLELLAEHYNLGSAVPRLVGVLAG